MDVEGVQWMTTRNWSSRLIAVVGLLGRTVECTRCRVGSTSMTTQRMPPTPTVSHHLQQHRLL